MSKKGDRGWCFTINNYTPDDLEQIKSLKAVYIVYAPEVCPTTGTPHYQGAVVFKDQITMSALSKKLKRASLRVMDGSALQNRVYIVGPWTGTDASGSLKSKPYNPDYVEIGTCPKGQGKRTDIDSMRVSLRENPSMRNVVETASSYQSVRMAEVFLKYHEKKRTKKTQIFWFYGDTGTGKTQMALDMADPDDTYDCMDTGRWFEGYDAHRDVIVQDIRPDFMSFQRMLNFMDYTPFRVETKGGSRQFVAERVFFTTPLSPLDFATLMDHREDAQQFIDRIDVIKYFTGESWRTSKNPKITIVDIK